MSAGLSYEPRRWQYTGSGYRTVGDAWLAELGGERRREERRIAREEFRWATGNEGRLE